MKWKIEVYNGGKNNLILIKNNKRHYIYSEKNPVEAGKKFYSSVYKGPGIYIIIGLGYFYHLLPFANNSQINKLIIVEPDEELFYLVKTSEMFSQLENNRRVTFIVGLEETKKFLEKLKGSYEFLFYDRLSLLSYPPLERLLPEVYRSIKDKINISLSELFRDGLTIAKFAKRWLLNFRRNFREFSESYDLLSLQRTYAGECIVAAAGPSLNRAISELKTIDRENYFIIAVDASVRPLILSGIVPDLIVNIDPQPYIRFHFFDVEKWLENIPVVLNPMASYEVFHLFNQRYLYSTRHPLLQIIAGKNSQYKEDFSFQSVSTLAVKIANFLGFNKIYLIGFDYSYSNYSSYAKDSFFYRFCLINSSKFNPFFTMEIGFISKKLRTNSSSLSPEELNNYKNELEHLIKIFKEQDQNVKLFNLFSQGVKINETKECSRIKKKFSYEFGNNALNTKFKLNFNLLEDSKEDIIKSLTLYYRLIKGVASNLAYKNARKVYKAIFSSIKNKITQYHDKV